MSEISDSVKVSGCRSNLSLKMMRASGELFLRPSGKHWISVSNERTVGSGSIVGGVCRCTVGVKESRNVNCYRRNSTSRWRCFRYLNCDHSDAAMRMRNCSSSEKRFSNCGRGGFFRFP